MVHVRAARYGRGVDDGHGVGCHKLGTAVVGVLERGGELARSVEPVESDDGVAGFLGAADFEDDSGPEGGFGEVVPGYGDGVVEGVVFVFVLHWMFCVRSVGGKGKGEGEFVRTLEFLEAL